MNILLLYYSWSVIFVIFGLDGSCPLPGSRHLVTRIGCNGGITLSNMLWNLDWWNHTNQNGNLPTEFFPTIHGRLMASWDATVITKATILVARKGSIIIFMPSWHRLTDVTRKAVAAMPVTLDIPIAIFYSYKITSSALLRQNLHQSFHQLPGHF